MREWENEFALSASKVTGSYLGEDTLTVREYGRQLLAESGEALLAAGVMPSAAHITMRRSRAWAYRFDFARSAISSGELPRRAAS